MTASTRRAALGAILAAPLASVPALAAPRPEERADYRARLLQAYADDRACRPIDNVAAPDGIEDKACTLIIRKSWATQTEVATLPPPETLAGLGLAALAAALYWEGEDPASESKDACAIGLIRAVLAFTGTTMPPGFIGFADDPGHRQRDAAVWHAEGSIAPWARVEAEAMSCA